MSSQIPTIHGPIRLLGTSTPGQRPGDGSATFSDGSANRPVLDRELFANFADGVMCMNGANGALRTFYFLDAAGFASWVASLPTTQPAQAGVAWSNNGIPQVTQSV